MNSSSSSDQKDEMDDNKHKHHGGDQLLNASPRTKINNSNVNDNVNDKARLTSNVKVDENINQALNNNQNDLRDNSKLVPISEDIDTSDHASKISAYARLDFDNFTFFVQTLHLTLGRKSNLDIDLQSNHHAVDVHLSNKKAVSRKHARLFYNFASQQFELSVEGRNGAFVDDMFVEKGNTVPLVDGTKIQIGDIPFVFVLPSIEVNETKANKKPFNPTDAVNLRSNLYSSKSPVTSPKKDKKLIPIDPSDKPLLPTSPRKSFSKQTRDSLLKLRRLSNARRKSLASVAGDEINDILKELGVSSIEAIDETDPDVLDSQIQSILNDHENNGGNLESSLMKLAQFNDSAIAEDNEKLDRLVTQHNLNHSTELDDLDEIEINLAELDEEIDTLRLNVNSQNQDLLSKLENKRLNLLQKKQLTLSSQQQKTLLKPSIGNPIIPPSLGASFKGKSAGPRMGKPASIQPPASRLYNNNGLNTPIDSRLVQATKLTGLSTSLLGKGLQPLDLTQPFPYNSSTLMKPLLPPGIPPPKLEGPIITITTEPSTIRCPPPLRAITTSYEPPLETFGIPTTIDEPSKYPKVPLRRNSLRKPPKKIYSLDEIPEQYRSKPSIAIPNMVTNALKSRNNENGLTLNEIYDAIKDMYPYYHYAPDGWQFSIAHNVKYNKIFKRLMKKGDEWSYALDELFISEREKVQAKQQEIIAAKAKAAALKAENLKLKPSFGARNFSYGLSNPIYKPGSQFVPNLPYSQTSTSGTMPGQKPKTIAELASEIRRDGVINSNVPLYFKPQGSTSPTLPSGQTTIATSPQTTIKEQLAANRSLSKSLSPVNTSTQSNTTNPQPYGTMNQDTKTSLKYLQKELFVLYKGKNLSFDTATTTEVITKALATTIAQVNAIGAKAGCGENALSFLIEKAPKQVTKILDIALTKSIKEFQSQSANTSGSATPITSGSPNLIRLNSGVSGQLSQQNIPPKPQTTPQIARQISPTQSTPSNPISSVTNTLNSNQPSPAPMPVTTNLNSNINSNSNSNSIDVDKYLPASAESKSVSSSQSLSKPQSYGLAKPSNYSSLGRPPSGLTRPVFNKPGALSRPPQFLSNKPGHQIGFESQSEPNEHNKRELIDEDSSKIIK